MRYFTVFFIFFILFLNIPARAQVSVLYMVDTVAGEALLEKNFQEALSELNAQTTVSDSGFWRFKKGIAYFYTGDFRNAQSNFFVCTQDTFSLAPFAFDYLGNIATLEQKPKEAAEAYLLALKEPLPEKYMQSLRTKLLALIKSNPLLTNTIPALKAVWIDTTRENGDQELFIDEFRVVDLLVHCNCTLAIDSVLTRYVDSATTAEACSLFKHLNEIQIPDTVYSTKLLFTLSRSALKCKANEMANSLLLKAMGRTDFNRIIPKKASCFHRALVAYTCGQYKRAIKLFKTYKRKYGFTPDMVLSVARAYRNLNDDMRSLNWYTLFIQLYPKDPAVYNVLWYIAWENEHNGNYQKAISRYRKINALKKKDFRETESLFRMGICYFKARLFTKAKLTFSHFIETYPDAAQIPGALYWKAKSAMMLGNKKEGHNLLSKATSHAPTDFYAFRARELLSLMGDSTSRFFIDTSDDVMRAKQWLDTISFNIQEKISVEDSSAFLRGLQLAFAGCVPLARFFLEPLEGKYPLNLSFQFILALLYKKLQDQTTSFRIGRKLQWKILFPDRIHTPLPVYKLSYPLAFFPIVTQVAQSEGIDSLLILSVIRQESIFDPSVVSRAGAIGLMQLMPSTAKAIAGDLQEDFAEDSLTQVLTNIRYGTYYLKKLLKQFDGNIVMAIAGYNGGPPKASEWFEKNKNSTFDLFVEDIGYDETRIYVKKVLANYWMYQNFVGYERKKG